MNRWEGLLRQAQRVRRSGYVHLFFLEIQIFIRNADFEAFIAFNLKTSIFLWFPFRNADFQAKSVNKELAESKNFAYGGEVRELLKGEVITELRLLEKSTPKYEFWLIQHSKCVLRFSKVMKTHRNALFYTRHAAEVPTTPPELRDTQYSNLIIL